MTQVRAEDFEYELDPRYIAQNPPADRSESRLLVLDRAGGRRHHLRFRQIGRCLRPGDVLVINDTRVLPARFFARRQSGGRLEGLFLRAPAVGRWEVMLKGAGRCRPDERLDLEGADAGVVLRENRGGGYWQVELDPPQPAETLLQRVGATPLPPYIHRPGATDEEEDRRRYQTVFASQPGAVAAPTAGLHFTDALLEELTAAGVALVRVTLHVGPGTFAPVKVRRLADHTMHGEWYRLPEATARTLNTARAERRRIVAVGTTVVRVLETVARADNSFHERAGWTDLFLYPPARFQAVDALITNFHLPRSTLLMLVAAFCSPGDVRGVKMILETYREAMEKGYRFYSYGDAMLIV